MKKLSDSQFLQLIDSGPLVAIDFIVQDHKGSFLLGKRKNAPAKDSWFVQGGRIYKDEPIASAILRISKAETGASAPEQELRFLGVSEHLYEDNFYGAQGISTHYIILVYEWKIKQNWSEISGDQHESYRWMTINEIFQDPDVHPNTLDYFKKYY